MNSIRIRAATGRSTVKTIAAVVAMVVLSGAANAALIARSGGMVYDSTRNITWLADMNYASTSAYTAADVNASGSMTWQAATTWASNLVYGGYSDWRLPTLNPADTGCSSSLNPGGGFPIQYYGARCTDSELSGLFVTELGNLGNSSVLEQAGDTAVQIANLALFSNVQEWLYWSSTEDVSDPDRAWRFATLNGNQLVSLKRALVYAVAVRPGDVDAAVPEPQTLALTLLALGAALVVGRRRSA